MAGNPFAENHAITQQEIPADHYVSNTPFTRTKKTKVKEYYLKQIVVFVSQKNVDLL
jgi:hypothetical protein